MPSEFVEHYLCERLTISTFYSCLMFNDVGEWAVALEHICTILAANGCVLSSQEMAELESLIDKTKKIEYEDFDDAFLNAVKEVSNTYSSRTSV